MSLRLTSTAKSNKRQLKYKRPWLYPKQEAALFDPARYALIEASTKSGKTVGGMVWIAEQAMAAKGSLNYWWVAPSYGQSRIAFRRLKEGLPREVYESNESEMTISLLNGAVIWFKSGEKPDNLYGEDVYAAVIDEATRLREEAWHAIRTTLTATRGPVRIIGNVRGKRNWAYRMARKAEAGEPNMAHHKIDAYDAIKAGILDAEEIEDARRQLPDHVFKELYLAEASDDEGNPFGIEAIRKCIRGKKLGKGAPVAWGWDLAKSVDWTVGIALDEDGNTCRFLRFQKPWQETFETIIRETGTTQASVDSTGVGDPVFERLQREGGPNFEGYNFSASSKQKLMEGLAVGIQKQEIGFPEGTITNELECFEYEYYQGGVRYSAPEGMHDDCVCSLALAYHMMREPEFSWRPV